MSETRRLYLLRHAKAEPAVAGGTDYERRLDAAGESDARAFASVFLARDLLPGIVVSSGSERTRGTLRPVVDAGLDAHVEFDDRLYTGEAAAYRELAETWGKQADVLLVGHDPAISDLARDLVAEDRSPAAERLRDGLQKGAVAIFRLQSAGTTEAAVLEDLLVPPFR